MREQQSKRNRDFRKDRYSPYRVGRAISNSDPLYLYRSVLESSAEAINSATRGLTSRGAVRIVDNFSLTLSYPGQINKLRNRSPLENPPDLSRVAAVLVGATVESLRQPVTASVKGVEHFQGVVGVSVTYPEYRDEQQVLDGHVKNLFGFGWRFDSRIGPGKLHIGIVAGSLAAAQMSKIENRLPDQIELDSVQNPNGYI